MSFTQLKNTNLGKSRANLTGSSGVGYTLYNSNGSVYQPHTTTGVYQTIPNSGIYCAEVTFPDNWRGSILWDTGAFATASYTTEQFNYEENNPNVDVTLTTLQSLTGSIQLIRDITAGRWHIVNQEMLFYAEDNVTLVAKFKLFDDAGVPSDDAVFQRVKV